MTDEIPIEKKFRILAKINRASHFAWREAALRCCPKADPQELVGQMWEITGEQTAQAYIERFDTSEELAPQLAASIVWSSQCMGEEARVEPGSHPGESLVRHTACPWHSWHADKGLLEEDRPGCDRWLEAMIRTINERLGAELRFETLSALPDGDDCCLRRLWVERG